MKLQDFTGGLNTRKEPYLIKISEAQEFTNIDNEGGALKPTKIPLADGESYTNRHRYIKFSGSVEQFAKVPLDFVEYQNKIYYSVEDDYPQMKDSNTEGDIGLYSPIITSADLLSSPSSVPTPISSEITIEEISPGTAFVGTNFGFQLFTTYQFAFLRVDASGNLSNPFYINVTPTDTGVALGGGVILRITLPYNYQVAMNVAGNYRRIETFQEFSGSNFVPVGVANVPKGLLRTFFTGTATNSGTQSFPIDLNTLENIVTEPGTYSYLATVRSTTLGWESEPSNLLTVDVLDTEQVSMEIAWEGAPGGNNILDSRIDELIIYRLGNNITDFTRVTTISNPTFPVTFIDRTPELSLAGNDILLATDYDKPLSGLKNLAIVAGQLCGTIGTKLYFSLSGKVFAFPSTNFREFREELTGLYVIDAGLLIFSLNKTWLLNTSNLATGKIIQLSDEFGCVAHNSIGGFRTGALWSSLYGISASFGGKVELMTKDKLGFQNLNIIKGTTHNETFWGFTEQGTIYALDFRYGLAIKFFNFTLFNDGDTNTVIHQVYRIDNELKVIFGTATVADGYKIFGSTEVATLIWRSPKFTEGALTERKTYKDIYVRATGDINFKVYIEDQTENLVAEENFAELETHHIKIDQEALQGYAIYFEVIGKGTIYEIEYKAMGRQNGR